MLVPHWSPRRPPSTLGIRFLAVLLAAAALCGGARAQRMPPPSKVESWISPHNLERLKLGQEALPEFKATTLPDGSQEPPRAPWPFLLYVVELDTGARQKLEERILADTRLVLATHAIKLVRIRPEQAIELPYLAQVSGIQDPTLIFVDRDFQVTEVLSEAKKFEERGVIKPLEKLFEQAYEGKLAAYVGAYVDLMKQEEKLWKSEVKVSELQAKAAKEKGARQAKYDAQADELEAEVDEGRDALGPLEDEIRASLRLIEAEAEALPTTIGSGRGKRELTPEELEAIAAFREFARHENPIVRAAAVEDLGALDSDAMAQFILDACSDTDPRVIEAAGRALGRMSSPAAMQVLLDALSSGKSKQKRAALMGLANVEAQVPGALARLRPFLSDRDDELRHAALRAVARQGDASAVPALTPLLEDSVAALRVMAAETLGQLDSPTAVPALCRALEDSDWSLKKAAAEALGKIRSQDSIVPLLERFEAEEGLMVELLYRAMVEVTGQDYSLDPGPWRRWWDRYGDRFQLPSDEQIAEARRKAKESMAAYSKPGKKSYHTITTLSKKLIFVIDVSASMRDKIAMPATVSEEEAARFPSRVKMDIAKNELIELLGALESNVKFNILTFAGDVERWKPGLVGASSRTAAIKYVAQLEAQSAPTTSRRRGVAAGGGEEQKTNTYGALLEAFGLSEDRAVDWKSRAEADTIFFVTDGVPTTGEIVDVPEVIRAITEINRTRGMVLHVVVFDQHTANRIRGLAENNGGQCVVRGFAQRP